MEKKLRSYNEAIPTEAQLREFGILIGRKVCEMKIEVGEASRMLGYSNNKSLPNIIEGKQFMSPPKMDLAMKKFKIHPDEISEVFCR